MQKKVPNPTLDYASPPPAPPRKLELRECADGFVLTWPLPPRWFSLGLTIFYCVAAGLALLPLVLVLYLVRQAGDESGLWRQAVLSVAFYLGSAIYIVIVELKWGNVPNALHLSGAKLIRTGHRFWGVYQKEWRINQIRQVELKYQKDLFRRTQTVADLVIRFHRGWPLRLRLRSDDPQLPKRVEVRLHQAMHATAK